MSEAAQVRAALADAADPAYAVQARRFFKTGPGEYGAGDVFLGVRVPATRAIVRRFADLPFGEIEILLDSEIHEERLAGLLILAARFDRASKARTFDDDVREEAVTRYRAAVRRGRVDNWDLVDSSAEYILGRRLLDSPRDELFELAAADSLWARRVALLSTFAFIKCGDATTTFALCERLLDDRRDLIQKAVGWMLREVGKRVDPALLTGFLDQHAPGMGRTALSYATEHLAPAARAAYRAAR